MTSAPGARRPSGVLKPWQRRLYRILLVPLELIAANPAYIAVQVTAIPLRTTPLSPS